MERTRNISKRRMTPCYGCPHREPGCHATCEDYLEDARHKAELREAEHREKARYAVTLGRKIKGYKPKEV